MLLLAADSKVVDATKVLGQRLDLYDIGSDNTQQLRAAADVARAIKSLTDDLARSGSAELGERLKLVLGRELNQRELGALAGPLSPEALAGYRDRWFAKQQTAEGASDLSIRYQPTGHADPWMTAWLDVLAEAASGRHAAIADPLLRAVMNPTAPGQCGSCHSVDRDATGRLRIQWRPFDPADEGKQYTRFDHGPHVMQPQMSDCTSCHRLAANAQVIASYSEDNPHRFVSGFEPMSRAACAACHTASAAGDGCTQCHSYHGTGGPLSILSTDLPSELVP
jgi:hypothetical protein